MVALEHAMALVTGGGSGNREAIAALGALSASDDARFVGGEAVTVDGGVLGADR